MRIFAWLEIEAAGSLNSVRINTVSRIGDKENHPNWSRSKPYLSRNFQEDFMNGRTRPLFFVLGLILLTLIAGCSFFGRRSSDYPRKGLAVTEPGGAELSVEPGALNQKTDIKIENVGEGEPLGGGSPLTPASSEYVVDFGEAEQIGAITMTVPLGTSPKQSAPASSDRVYVTWAEPEGGTPSVVGTVVTDNKATFPVVGSGKYQVYSTLSHEALLKIVSILEPLAVPSYQQLTPAWCSPTAMTNLAQFHEGQWQSGGLGSTWGESSNFYLAGQAGQPFDAGYFFHWLLGAGGYTVPSSVKQSFSNGNVEVIIWNWKALVDSGFSNPFYAEALFNYFQAYAESYLWGVNSARRPVAWGSSLAAHSRTITGSNGTELYYNDPSSGSVNQTRTWEDYKNTIIGSLTTEKIEIIDTVVFQAQPRPAAERTGVLWLYPSKSSGYPGSAALVSGSTGDYVTNWIWDGSGGHSNGYYYQDLAGILPSDPVFGVQFQAFHYQDEVEISYGVRNITDQNQDYLVEVSLTNSAGTVNEVVHQAAVTVGPGGRTDNIPAERFRIANKPPGEYRLFFVLKQSGTQVDAKWVKFRIHKSDKLFIEPHGFIYMDAFCRKGPDIRFDGVKIYKTGTEVKLVGVNPERTWGLFEREIDSVFIRCWIALSVVETIDEENAPVVPVPTLVVDDKSAFSCSNYESDAGCTADARCTWVAGLVPGYCTEK